MTTSVAVEPMKAAQVTSVGAGLKIVELKISDPGPGQVRIKVHACGVCHSDAIIVEGRRRGIPSAHVPGCEPCSRTYDWDAADEGVRLGSPVPPENQLPSSASCFLGAPSR
jgi:D-arabinose 1-dehydrogenase-like Zn-dependent alcohol dehydrogenase